MTTRDDTPTQIYVPALRRELVRQTLPASVRFLDPGLPETVSDGTFYHPAHYPLSPEEAKHILNELLAVGETLGPAAVADSLAVRMIQEQSLISAGEKADIARFAAPSPSGVADAAGAGRESRIAAQKVLLLVWDLEKRLLEITALRREIAAAVKPLAENLHGASEEDVLKELAGVLPGALPDELAALTEISPAMTPDWRLALSAMAVFLPQGAVLVTSHEGLRDALADAGMLLPLPEETAAGLAGWPEELRSRLLRAKAPLWNILGHSREPENSPWLTAAPEILVCPA